MAHLLGGAAQISFPRLTLMALNLLLPPLLYNACRLFVYEEFFNNWVSSVLFLTTCVCAAVYYLSITLLVVSAAPFQVRHSQPHCMAYHR